MQKEKPAYGMITEQGDLGLGFSVLKESEQSLVEDDKKKREDEENE